MIKKTILLKLALLGSLTVGLQAEFLRDDSKNIVLDSSNGLIWQDDTVVKTTTRNWADAITYCEGLSVGGYDDWRLPNQNELRSIADKSRANPSLSPIFVNFASDHYWSSTSTSDSYVHFYGGFDYTVNGVNSGYVRCVRGGM